MMIEPTDRAGTYSTREYERKFAAWGYGIASRRAQQVAEDNRLLRQQLDEYPLQANDKQVAGTHYKDMGVQPWAVVDTWSIEQQIGYYRGGALKYVMRLGTKDEQLQEARKAGHYIEKLIEVLESVNSSPEKGAGT